MAIEDFYNLVGQIQDQGMDSLEILKNITTIQQRNQEQQYQNQILETQRAEQIQEKQYAMAKQAALTSASQARNDIYTQINSNNQILDFKNQVTSYNQQVLSSNAAALESSLKRDQQTVMNTASARVGDVNSAFASNHIIANTGSAQGVVNQVIDESAKQGQELYTDKINKINSVMAAIMNEGIQKSSNELATKNANIQLSNKLNRL